MADDEGDIEFIIIIEEVISLLKLSVLMVLYYKQTFVDNRRKCRRNDNSRVKYVVAARLPAQIHHLTNLIESSNRTCVEQLRMDRDAFGRLCYLIENVGGLGPSKNVSVSEQLAMFLSVLAHHKKNVTVKFDFFRSGHTVSLNFHRVLNAVLKLHSIFSVNPVAVDESSTDPVWKWFKGCLGALDGTHVGVRVPLPDKPRYRNRKGETTVNVLGVCDKTMRYIYVTTGWEGLAADSRVLCDAVTRPNRLKVPSGKYYLCDGGYTNGPGFLAPYRGVRYHLDEWTSGARSPQNYKELFNLRHSKARNVIERSFGILKMRWSILRSPAFYDITTQNKMIMACCLLHNFIRSAMETDPMESEELDYKEDVALYPDVAADFIDQVEASPEWTEWREFFAQSMYNDYCNAM